MSQSPRHTWKDDQRTTLHLIRHDLNHDDHDNIAKIFNHLFANDLRQSGFPNGFNTYRIRDEYSAKFKAGRAKVWAQICKDEQSEEEQQARAHLKQRIEDAATAVGVELPGLEETVENDGIEIGPAPTTLPAQSPPPSDHTLEQPSPKRPTKKRKARIDISNEEEDDQLAQPWLADATHLDQEPSTVADEPAPALNMVHGTAETSQWLENIPHSLSAFFVPKKHEVYKLGGKVFRAVIDGDKQDVMVCNFRYGALCKLGPNVAKRVFASESPCNALPFIHESDLTVIPAAGFKYAPSTQGYDGVYPLRKFQWKTCVRFWDGKKRDIMTCVHARCSECAGQESVKKQKAYHESLGVAQRRTEESNEEDEEDVDTPSFF